MQTRSSGIELRLLPDGLSSRYWQLHKPSRQADFYGIENGTVLVLGFGA